MATVNGTRGTVTEDLVFNTLMRRTFLANDRRTLFPQLTGSTNTLDPPNRDIDRECGYKTYPTVHDYKLLHRRNGIARRVNSVYPDESWAVYPELYEAETGRRQTRFELAWQDMMDLHAPWHYLHRVDVDSGIGHYGILLLGLDDRQDLEMPAPASGNKLNYMRSFDQTVIQEIDWTEDETDPRYGQPEYYTINFALPSSTVMADAINSGTYLKTRRVHWSRVLHVCEHRSENNEWVGAPRSESVLNYIYDIRKVGGSSAEMYWKAGFPGYAFETYPDLAGESSLDLESLTQDMVAFQNGLQRFLAAVGGSWKSLAQQVADPTPTVRLHLELICATIGVPIRVFLGSESGHLASTQDIGTWRGRLRGRQLNYVEPMIVRPFVDRLISLGCLPAPASGRYTVNWKDLNSLTETDRADIALKRAQTIMQYVTGQGERVIPPHEFWTVVVGLTDQEADAITAAAKTNATPATFNPDVPPGAPPPAPTPQGGGKTGNPNTAAEGKPAGKVASDG